MSEQYEDSIASYEIVIDTTTKEPIDKTTLLAILKLHHVKTAAAEDSKIVLAEVIPSLRKAKVNLPEAFFKDLASKVGLHFLEYAKIRKLYQKKEKSQLVSIVPYAVICKYKVIVLEINGSVIDLAVDNPLDKRVMVTLQTLFSTWKINLCVVSTKAIDWAIDSIYREIHKKIAMLDLYNRTPDQSAYKVLYPSQKYFIIALTAAIAVSMIISSAATFMVLFAAISIGYFIINPFKIYISILGFKGARAQTRITQAEVQAVSDKDLPVYTVLIPIFHETEVLAQNMRNIYHLNYPKDKLDIKILMEEGDKETINEAKLLGLFGSTKKMVEGIPRDEYSAFLKLFDPIIVPAAQITTKPRACNYGLLRAKGELCVIYDAEDNPDPDQLKKAALVFSRSNENLVCLQSKLNFYNADENLLTKWFSIEYSNWFEFYLQGLDWVEAPIPLGGTSNHFRKKSLDELGRWDPYNVTEDADLGLRLARNKMKTEIIDSYTYEEATVTSNAWIRQRSRWYKGHVQTYLVHMRQPAKLLKDLGTKSFLKFQWTFGANIFMPIINSIFWIIMAASIILPISFGWLIPSYLQPICIFNLVVGNLSFLLIYVVACLKLKKYKLTPYAILMPLYWVLISMASWRGLIQLIRKPFYWDKTSHGVSKVAKAN
jgi:cellulose synthase/poly-beta-1,6-N-acetylglucosamine synthase-like glycosyltransferase